MRRSRRAWWAVGTWTALSVASAGCTGGDALPAVVPPAVTYPVGVTTRTWVDSSRGTPANHAAPALPARTLVTEVWYPARGGGAGGDAGDTGNVETRDAPADTAGGAHPLVLFVHGSSGGRRQSTFLTRALAAAGYVVAAADFPLTAGNTPGGPSDLHVDDQRADLAFLADRVTAAAGDRTDVLGGAVDVSGYAVVGHSTGGTMALVAAYAPDAHDPRVRAAVALAPCACFLGDGFFRTRALPLLVVGGTDDLFVPLATNGQRAFTLAPPPRLFARLVGGNHLYFTDVNVSDAVLSPTPTTAHDDIAVALARYGGGTACEPAPPAGTDPPLPFADQHARTVTIVQAFLDGALRHQGGALAAVVAHPDPDVVFVQ